MFILRTDASGRQQAEPKMIKLSSVESLTLGSELACLCFAIPPPRLESNCKLPISDSNGECCCVYMNITLHITKEMTRASV